MMRPAEGRMRKLRAGLEANAAVFEPFVEGLLDVVRRGGRLILLGEGRLHPLAEFLAAEVVGRRHRNGLMLPADILDISSGDPQAIARRVGPYDAILAIATDCETPLFSAVLDAAKARGARIYCLCTGRARVEGKVTIAVDVPEARPHHVAGHLSSILHFLSKRTLARLGANPLIRPVRLDGGPPRPLSASGSGTHPSFGEIQAEAAARAGAEAGPPAATAEEGGAPAAGAEAAALIRAAGTGEGAAPGGEGSAPGEADEVTELVIDLEPDSADLRLVEAHAEATELPRPEPTSLGLPHLPPPPPPTDGDGRLRLIQFRCRDCREPILADPGEAGSRARCPFCGRRVKVPHSSGRLYRPVEAALSQGARPVSLRFGLADCRFAITQPGGGACEGKIEDLGAFGIEALLPAAAAKSLPVGQPVEVRIETPAFLEPLLTTAVVERILAPKGEPEGPARTAWVRALLPLHESATKEARDRLARLSDLTAGSLGSAGEGKTAHGRR